MKTLHTFQTVLEHLDSHEKGNPHLMQIARQLIALQNDCNASLPSWFSHCRIVKLENETLVIGVPNQALAARLRQQTPFLKNKLEQKGWQINTIRLKILFSHPFFVEKTPIKKQDLPPEAYEAFSKLYDQIIQSDSYSPLAQALHRLVFRHAQTKNHE